MQKLNANIYNKLVKVFNDAANNKSIKEYRDEIIALRKKFPTYSELLAMDLWYVDSPVINVNGEDLNIVSWTGQFDNDAEHAHIKDCSIVYTMELIKSQRLIDFKPCLSLKIRGIPTLSIMKNMHDQLNAHPQYAKQIELLEKVLSK